MAQDIFRRKLMQKVAGVFLADAMGIKPQDIADTLTSQAQKSAAMAEEYQAIGKTVLDTLPETNGIRPDADDSFMAESFHYHRILTELRQPYIEKKRKFLQPKFAMPAHIASKKSWSDVYKQSETLKEYREIEQILAYLDDSRDLRKHILTTVREQMGAYVKKAFDNGMDMGGEAAHIRSDVSMDYHNW